MIFIGIFSYNINYSDQPICECRNLGFTNSKYCNALIICTGREPTTEDSFYTENENHIDPTRFKKQFCNLEVLSKSSLTYSFNIQFLTMTFL